MTDHIRPDNGQAAGGTRHRTYRPQQRSIATRAAIVEAFAIAFDTAGFAATTMNEVINANALTKGAVYFHFLSKEALAQLLVEKWNDLVAQSFSDAAAAGGSIAEQLRTVFVSLAERIDNDRSIRAGFKLTLDPSIDGAHASYRRWIDTTSDLVESGIRSGSISDTVMSRRLGWNLCSGFVGAVHSVSILRENLDLSARTADMLSSYLIVSAVRGKEL
ncbi:TetR/AcrR family transcriptional regulator [Rhodococcus qingshengii]|uniref:TetR/AcrR family transcriptional regulator n=1 Tax=Rhodococcus qingshengii TaxID=334542 RepID=UPI00237C873F|nr:TetR/AcrR family transcriptional regulator [Rhodococcus qingshengii]WCT05902.1 TetR family transcriptional regulator [Rhodococcus qingshengii]